MNTNESYLSFKLAGESFALSVHKVLEVLQKQELIVVPNTPEYVEGVMNFRGEIIPVIELRKKMNLPARDPNAKYVTIIMDLKINNAKAKLGAIVDGVREVLDVDDINVLPVPEIGSSFNVEFLHGMLKKNDEFTMLLDIDKIFSEEDSSLLSKISK